MANDTNTRGLCEAHPEKTGWPTRKDTEATIDMLRACDIPAWPEKCGTCGSWHIVRADEKK